MALINCPECRKEVSDAAKICPNCGYSIRDYLLEIDKRKKQNEYNKLKEVEFNKLQSEMENELKQIDNSICPTKSPKQFSFENSLFGLFLIILPAIFFFLYKIVLNASIHHSWLVIVSCILFILFIISIFFFIAGIVILTTSSKTNKEYAEKISNYDKWKEKEKENIRLKYKQYAENIVKYGQRENPNQKHIDNNILKCPRCGSTTITTGQRGFNFIWGFLGSNKTTNRCGQCGYSWQPHK